MASAWNGGEFWGYDGRISPIQAAHNSFDAGDYRFLHLKITDPLGQRIDRTPDIFRCDNHPHGRDGFKRFNSITSTDDIDGVKRATEFAYKFNFEMLVLLSQSQIADCNGFGVT